MTETNCKGIREESYFKIPIERVIWPIKHTCIGIGNQIQKIFVDIVNIDIEIKSPKEITLREQHGGLDKNIYKVVEEREMWDNRLLNWKTERIQE